jgi:NitT/TauT family transport system permease protein
MPTVQQQARDHVTSGAEQSVRSSLTADGPAGPAAAALGERILREERNRRRQRLAWMWLIRIAAVVIAVAAWQVLAVRGVLDVQIVSKPDDVAAALVDYFRSGSIYPDLVATLQATILGLVVGAAAGILLGVVLAKLPLLERAVNPYLTLLNALPRPALAPIFLVWFGLGISSKVTVAASLVIFVLLLNTLTGIASVDPDIENLGRSLAISGWQRFWLVDLPSSLPFIVAGLRLGAVYSVLGVIVTEMVASYEGLGQQLILATTNIQMDKAFAVILVAGTIAVLLNGSISYLEYLVRRRYR